MKFSQMEYFLAVAEELNFTAAAKSLYISQPALSKQIALLEEELDTKLFLRNSRNVVLTAAGIQFEQDLKEIRQQLEQAKSNAMRIGKTEKLTIRIGCFDGAIMEDFLPAVYQYIQDFDSNIQISLFRGNFSENRKALEKGEIDLLFTLDLDLPFDETYQIQKILKRRGALIYSEKSPLAQKNPLTLPDFALEPLLVLNRQTAPGIHRDAIENLRKLGIPEPQILETENFATLFATLELGHGYSILTEEVTLHHPKLHKYILDHTFGTWIIAAWKRGHPLTELLMDRFCAEKIFQ